jgi:hypothetical protein
MGNWQVSKVLNWWGLLKKRFTKRVDSDPSVDKLIETIDSLKVIELVGDRNSKTSGFEKTFRENASLSVIVTLEHPIVNRLSSLIWIHELEHTKGSDTSHRKFAPVSDTIFFPCHVLKTYRVAKRCCPLCSCVLDIFESQYSNQICGPGSLTSRSQFHTH